MKAIMRSLSPKDCNRIAHGEKTIDVVKVKPKLKPPFKVYMYCTKARILGELIMCKSNENSKLFGYGSVVGINKGFKKAEDELLIGKVIGEFVCDRVFELKINGDDYGNYWHEWDDEGDIQDMCLSYEELETYLGKSVGYGWHISDLKIYDEPKELDEFRKPCGLGTGCEDCDDIYFVNCKNTLTRPPQSWCYVEEKGEWNLKI